MTITKMQECCKCSIEKPLHEFGKDKRLPAGVGHVCRNCRSAQKRQRYWSSEEVRKKSSACAMASARRNKERISVERVARKKLERRDLADAYIRKLLNERGWPLSAITPEVIVLKREQLLARRLAAGLHAAIDEYFPPPPREDKLLPTAEDVEAARLKENARFRARYAANLGKERARIYAYKAAHPEKVAAQRERAKQRAKEQKMNSAKSAGASGQKSTEDTEQ